MAQTGYKAAPRPTLSWGAIENSNYQYSLEKTSDWVPWEVVHA